MLNPLFIQLFGRDVVDRLEHAGLESDEAIAQLDAEALSTQAGIAPGVAQRVVDLAVELWGPHRPQRARRGGTTKARSSKSGTRPKRKTRDEPVPADRLGPAGRAAAPSGRTAAPSEPDEKAADEESPEVPMLQQSGYENITFVDEAGLIAWMGFASRTGPEGSLLSGVADGILEPASSSEPDPPLPRASVSSPAPAASRPGTATPANSNTVILEGSFWGFGGRPHGGVTVSPASSGESRPAGQES